MSSYQIPKVELGQIVNWYPHGRANQEPHVAIVTKVNYEGKSLNLNIFSPQSYNQWLRDGVRHVSDPGASEHEKADSGLWDFTNRDKKIDKLLKDFDGAQ